MQKRLRSSKNTQTFQKSLNDPENRCGVVTHLESDILECGVKWALGSIATKFMEVVEFQLS